MTLPVAESPPLQTQENEFVLPSVLFRPLEDTSTQGDVGFFLSACGSALVMMRASPAVQVEIESAITSGVGVHIGEKEKKKTRAG